MRPLRFLGRNPLLVLAAIVATFVGWICWDAASPLRLAETPGAVTPTQIRTLPALVEDGVIEQPQGTAGRSKLTLEGTAQAISKLKHGMPRTEVESLVGAPGAGHISPATVAGERVFYHTWYEADLAPPATVRPLGRTRPNRTFDPPPPALVTLEFDATKPGHPLVGIYYPDPLF